MSDRVELLKSRVRDVPDFPKPGILFKDLTPLLADPRAFTTALDLIAEQFAGERIDTIVGIESRGFIFGAALAARMTIGFVPVRKPGKLPYSTDKVSYQLEYGTDALEIHTDALKPGARVLIVDDVIATGGTAAATCELVRRQRGAVVGLAFVVELAFLSGRDKLAGDSRIYSILQY